MTEVASALNEVRNLYAKFLGQPAPPIGPGWYAPFPPGIDPVRFAIQEAAELKRHFAVAWVPRADIYGTKDAVTFRIEIPGVGREHVKVLVAEGECIVRGTRATAAGEGDLRPLELEIPYGAFERRFPLPLHADADKLVARYADGLLEVTIPILEVAPPKEMKVERA